MSDEDEYKTCGNCQGSGKIRDKQRRNPWSGKVELSDRTCGMCGGSGKTKKGSY